MDRRNHLMSFKSMFILVFFPSIINAIENGTFSQRYAAPSLDLMTPTQIQGYEVILRIFKTNYREDELGNRLNIDCKVIDQHLSYDRGNSTSHKNDIFAQYRYLDVDFTLTWSYDSIGSLAKGNVNRFMEFMNSEEGYNKTVEYISELGLPIEEVYPLRLVQPTAPVISSADPPLPLFPTSEPSEVVERFSLTIAGPQLKLMTRDEMIAFQIFLELFTVNFGKSGGEPNVDTSCQIINQDLSLSSSRRNLFGKISHFVRLGRSRDLTNIDSPSLKDIYFLDIQFAMIWQTSNPEIDLVSENYLEDFKIYMRSDAGVNNLKSKLNSVGVLVEKIGTLRVIDTSNLFRH